MRLLASLVITALSLLLAAEIVPGIVVTDFWKALVAALVLGILNVTVKPILVILTLPITILTLGIFFFVLNGLFFAFAASLIEGFEVDGLIPAILGSLIVAVASTIGNSLIRDDRNSRKA